MKEIFASIKKGIKNALNELLNLQNELIGNELYTLEFVANGLLASPVLQKGVSPDERFKIKNTIINILDEIDNHYIIISNKINDNYKQDMNKIGNELTKNIEKNITIFSNKSNILINEIKSKIESIRINGFI